MSSDWRDAAAKRSYREIASFVVVKRGTHIAVDARLATCGAGYVGLSPASKNSARDPIGIDRLEPQGDSNQIQCAGCLGVGVG
jgi:hypothetical protein